MHTPWGSLAVRDSRDNRPETLQRPQQYQQQSYQQQAYRQQDDEQLAYQLQQDEQQNQRSILLLRQFFRQHQEAEGDSSEFAVLSDTDGSDDEVAYETSMSTHDAGKQSEPSSSASASPQTPVPGIYWPTTVLEATEETPLRSAATRYSTFPTCQFCDINMTRMAISLQEPHATRRIENLAAVPSLLTDVPSSALCASCYELQTILFEQAIPFRWLRSPRLDRCLGLAVVIALGFFGFGAYAW